MKREKTKGLKVMESIKSKRRFFFSSVKKSLCPIGNNNNTQRAKTHPKTINFLLNLGFSFF
jgi:hypothetical protein